MAAIEAHGGKLIVMASRALARVARSPADYERVYDRVLMQSRQPVILHWLGEMFDPQLAGYWLGSEASRGDAVDRAMNVALGVIAANPGKVDGIKISLLDKDKEIAMRRRLPEGVRMYTGDDFNYAELIAGDGIGTATNQHTATRCSASSTRSRRQRAPRSARSPRRRGALPHAILAPTVPCRATSSRRRRASTRPASSFSPAERPPAPLPMVGGQQSARSLLHFAEAVPPRRRRRPARAARARGHAHAHLLALHGLDG
jgi:hypothetical protein